MGISSGDWYKQKLGQLDIMSSLMRLQGWIHPILRVDDTMDTLQATTLD